MSDTALTSEQIAAKRAEKLRTRRYFVVSFSDTKLPEGKPFRCWDCGEIVTSVYKEPREMHEVSAPTQEIASDEKVGGLCRKSNIMYLFVWYGHS